MFLVAKTDRSIDEVSDDEFYQDFDNPLSSSQGDYTTVIDNWLSIYPQEQLWVGFLDDIWDKPEQFLRNVFTHIGVTSDISLNDFPYNSVIYPGPGIPIPDRFADYLTDLYSKKIEALCQRFGDKIARWRVAAKPQ